MKAYTCVFIITGLEKKKKKKKKKNMFVTSAYCYEEEALGVS